jgi:endosialidase-like protein
MIPLMKPTNLPFLNSVNLFRMRLALLLLPLAFACFALAPTVRGVTPAPDGGYPGFNTAEGENALLDLTTGTSDTAIGYQTLLNNTTGTSNTAVGASALINNTIGYGNTATGSLALQDNITGSSNTANGSAALALNITGSYNTATGFSALQLGQTGNNNTADGATALENNLRGQSNTAVGYHALGSNSDGSSNIALGSDAGLNITGNNNIDIGNEGFGGDSRTIRIGTKQTHRATFIAGISRATIPTGIPVIVDDSGHLGTITSSARFKEQIQPMDKASEAILSLQPVTFRYKHDLDPEGIPQFGLVAEEVEKVNPDLVARDEQGKAYTVRYEAVNAMVLNEFLKEHRKVEAQESKIEQQEAKIAHQQKQIDALTAGLQKVN